MSDRVYAGIITRYNAASLDTSIGPIASVRAPSKTGYPHTVLRLITDITDTFSSTRSYRRVTVNCRIMYKEANSSDPIAQGGTYNRALIAGLNAAKITIPSSEGIIWEQLCIRQHIEDFDLDERLWMADTDWLFKIGQAATVLKYLNS